MFTALIVVWTFNIALSVSQILCVYYCHDAHWPGYCKSSCPAFDNNCALYGQQTLSSPTECENYKNNQLTLAPRCIYHCQDDGTFPNMCKHTSQVCPLSVGTNCPLFEEPVLYPTLEWCNDPPTVSPTPSPTPLPTLIPTPSPTHFPTTTPTPDPTLSPTKSPLHDPTAAPSNYPSAHPSNAPSLSPTQSPTTLNPSYNPSYLPSIAPSYTPTTPPTAAPTYTPTNVPSNAPSSTPSSAPSSSPTFHPTSSPTSPPTLAPSFSPSRAPSQSPSTPPTIAPSYSPSNVPSHAPTTPPTAVPTGTPTNIPSVSPTQTTADPSYSPSFSPSHPTMNPTSAAKLDNSSSEIDVNERIFVAVIITLCIVFCLLFSAFVLCKYSKYCDQWKKPYSVNNNCDTLQLTGVASQEGVTLITHKYDNDSDLEGVKQWLTSTVGYAQYYDLFISNGYDKLNTIKEIESKQQVIDIGIELQGHQTKLWAEIKKLKVDVNRTNFI